MNDLNKQEIFRTLERLDAYLFENVLDESFISILLVGSSPLIIKEITPRVTTTDIDVFVFEDINNLQSIENLLGDKAAIEIRNKFDVNSDVYFF